jgi:hypothetical protein
LALGRLLGDATTAASEMATQASEGIVDNDMSGSLLPEVQLATELNGWLGSLGGLEQLVVSGAITIEATHQVMYDGVTGTLIHGDLTELWSEGPVTSRC